jgi:hypothetical protein
MDPQNQTPLGTSNPTPTPTPVPAPVQTPTEEKSVGSAIGIIIIIVIIILGGLYFWGQRVAKQAPVEPQQQTTAQAQQPVTPGADINQLNTQSSADDLNSIQADVKATNLNDLGTEVSSVNAAAAASAVPQAQ